jgi:hypothetical protein
MVGKMEMKLCKEEEEETEGELKLSTRVKGG